MIKDINNIQHILPDVQYYYYLLENDPDYKNLHFMKRKEFLSREKKDEEYVQKLIESSGKTRDELRTDCINFVLNLRKFIINFEQELFDKINRKEITLTESIDAIILKKITQYITENYKNDIFVHDGKE